MGKNYVYYVTTMELNYFNGSFITSKIVLGSAFSHYYKMNSSVISAYDNVSTQEILFNSFIFRKLDDVLHVNTDLNSKIFCPFCITSFSFKFCLFEHLKTFHENFLMHMINQSLKFKECLFCKAKFYGKHLTAKHALRYHSSIKVMKELFLNKDELKCAFCSVKFKKENINGVVNHIEELHFTDFEEEFKKMSNITTQEVLTSGLIDFSILDRDLQCTLWEDVCMEFEKPTINNLNVQKFDKISKMNCYDFTKLKQQLENIKDIKNSSTSEVTSKKSMLKDVKNFSIPKRSARRVLKFDLPFNNQEEKENAVLEKKISKCKQTCTDNYHQLCDNKISLFSKPSNTFNESPQYSSTPNSMSDKVLKDNKNIPGFHKSTFTSYNNEKKITDFEFQCGKCRLLFKENLELVSHVKSSHKKFSLKAFQPCYYCAICNAKFFKNRYLKKHHNLHRPY